MGALLLTLLTACRVPGAVLPAIKVGLVAPFEGRYRYVGYDLFPAVRLALREANAAGGLAGPGGAGPYAVELAAYDDAAQVEMAPEQARKLSADPQVLAAIGHFREETTAAALPAYDAAGLALVAPAVLDPALGANDTLVFRLGPDARAVAVALLEGVESAGLVSASPDAHAHPRPLCHALVDAAREQGLVLSPTVSLDETDWLEQVVGADPSVLLCEAEPVGCGEVLRALRTAGWLGEFRGGPDLAAADFAAVAGPWAEGTVFVTPWPFPQDLEGGAAFSAAYQEVSGGAGPGPLALPAYWATRWLLEALRADLTAHQTPSRAGVAEALSSLRPALLQTTGLAPESPLYWYRLGAGGTPRLERVAE